MVTFIYQILVLLVSISVSAQEVSSQPAQPAQTAPAFQAPQTTPPPEEETPYDVFENVWELGKANIYPFAHLLSFNESTYRGLRKKAAEANNLQDVADVINPFLDKLKVSHTQFYTKDDMDYYYLKSILGTRDPHSPKIYHIGVQYAEMNGVYHVRTVLDGYPAKKAGLRRGDMIHTVNGKPFHPVKSFASGKKKHTLVYSRKGEKKTIEIPAVHTGLGHAYHEATRLSARVIKHNNKKIGYVHLWSGAFESNKLLADIVEKKFLGKVDGVILDLRDGYGAAWWDHLDPFHTNRESYFTATSITRYGDKQEMKAEKMTNPKAFTQPLVVLINRGTRSGKEAMAFQFKKTKRAQLVGVNTAGAFVAGAAHYADQDKDYLLYISSSGLLLDGVDLEGTGVKPDHEVEYKTTDSLNQDPQLQKALSLI